MKAAILRNILILLALHFSLAALANSTDVYNEDPYNENPVDPSTPNTPPVNEPPATTEPPVTSNPPSQSQEIPKPPVASLPNEEQNPQPATPSPEPTTQPAPIKLQCDLLIDKTGIYLGMMGSNYLAIKNVNECRFYETNRLNQKCNPDKLITVLAPENAYTSHEMIIPQNSLITVIEKDDPQYFICVSLFRGISIGIDKTRVLLVTPKVKKSRWF